MSAIQEQGKQAGQPTPWIAHSMDEVLLPGAGWHTFLAPKLQAVVRARADAELDWSNPAQVQLLFHVMGHIWALETYPDVPLDPGVLQPPFLPPEALASHAASMRTRVLGWISQDLPRSQVVRTPEYQEHFATIHDVLEQGFPREMCRRAMMPDAHDQRPAMPPNALDVLGTGLAHLFSLEQSLWSSHLSSLAGAQLPPTLRKAVWSHRLRDPGFVSRIAVLARENNSPDSLEHVRNSSVGPMLLKLTAGMPDSAERTRLLLVLLHYYLLRKRVQPRLVPMAKVLLDVFHDAAVPDLAAMLHVLVERCVPSHEQAGRMRERLIQELRDERADLMRLMDDAFGSLDADKAPVASAQPGILQHGLPDRLTRDAPDLVYLKWITTGFAGFLRPTTVKYVWDQCFALGWDTALPTLLFVVADILEESILECSEATAMYDCLTSLPCLIHTLDVRSLFLGRYRDQRAASR